MRNWRSAIIFGVLYAVIISWGLELSLDRIFMISFGSGIAHKVTTLWGINVLRILFMFFFLKWLNLTWSDLWRGKLSFRQLGLAVLCILPLLLLIDIPALIMKSYQPQIVGEYQYFLELASGGRGLALLALFSQYIYYVIEVLSVNMLYLGSAKFIGKRNAIVIPVIFWGAMHILQALSRPLPIAIAVAILTSIEAGIAYCYVYKIDNMKGPILMFLIIVIFAI